MGEHISEPYLKKRRYFFERGVLQLRQPYIRMTGFLKESPQLHCVVTSHFKIVFIWWSVVGDGVVSAHKLIPSNGCRDSFDSDFVL